MICLIFFSLYKGYILNGTIHFEVSIKFQSFRVVSLFAYLEQPGSFSPLFVIFSFPEFPFQSSILSFCYYFTLLEES
jgi:hypothetical protein